jgi:hypothetical protein
MEVVAGWTAVAIPHSPAADEYEIKLLTHWIAAPLYIFLQALPIFLDSLVPSFGAILISVTLILAFGEVTPFILPSRSLCPQFHIRIQY